MIHPELKAVKRYRWKSPECGFLSRWLWELYSDLTEAYVLFFSSSFLRDESGSILLHQCFLTVVRAGGRAEVAPKIHRKG